MVIRFMQCYVNYSFVLNFSIRDCGSAASTLAFIAKGSIDALLDYGLHAWDIAAGIIIVQEAGGVVIDPTDSKSLD